MSTLDLGLIHYTHWAGGARTENTLSRWDDAPVLTTGIFAAPRRAGAATNLIRFHAELAPNAQIVPEA